MAFRNSSSAQHTLAIKVGGKPYLIFVTEGGSGGIPKMGGGATPQEACDAGLTPFPMGRIIDISDEANPKLVSTLGLETHDIRNCSKVMPDVVGGGISSPTAAISAVSTTGRTQRRLHAGTLSRAFACSRSTSAILGKTEGNRILQSRTHAR